MPLLTFIHINVLKNKQVFLRHTIYIHGNEVFLEFVVSETNVSNARLFHGNTNHRSNSISVQQNSIVEPIHPTQLKVKIVFKRKWQSPHQQQYPIRNKINI